MGVVQCRDRTSNIEKSLILRLRGSNLCSGFLEPLIQVEATHAGVEVILLQVGLDLIEHFQHLLIGERPKVL